MLFAEMRSGRHRQPVTTINERLATVEAQVARLVSDAQSEKGTRSRSNDRIDKRFDEVEKRLRCVERNMYIAMGGLGALEIGLRFVWR